jgi:hypothetical protein
MTKNVNDLDILNNERSSLLELLEHKNQAATTVIFAKN